ncbi:MAG TPA: hypothetical protein VK612_13080 [Pyrinomonadaceae bacterium]|nr:hypothetical protein [Pyrinomonadaceae bacterium]
MRKSSLFSLISFALITFVLGTYGIAQTPITGDWTANIDTKGEKGEIHLSFERKHENGGKSQNGTNYNYSDLEGLSREQTQNGRVSFRLVREAGTIECEGSFANGRGVGTFRFTPSRSFIDGMRSRGFDFEKVTSSKHSNSPEEKLFAAATLNVTTALADDLKSANFGDLDIDDLFKAAIFKIDGKFMAEMKATGFPDLGMEDLVKARIFKIDAEYVRQVKEMGFTSDGFEGLVKFRIFKVTPEFLNEMRAAGFEKMSSEDIVKCRIFKIDAEFARQARAEEPNVSVEEMVQMKIGVRRRKE